MLQPFWYRHIPQFDILWQPVSVGGIGFPDNKGGQISTGCFSNAETVSADKVGWQQLLLVGDRGKG
jgi:hypothetical protein